MDKNGRKSNGTGVD